MTVYCHNKKIDSSRKKLGEILNDDENCVTLYIFIFYCPNQTNLLINSQYSLIINQILNRSIPTDYLDIVARASRVQINSV